MEATTTSSLCISLASAPPPHPFSGDILTCRRKGFGGAKTRINIKALGSRRSDAHSHSHNFDGKLVDASMVVLRKRIHEMNMSEKNYEPPRHWMEWEKQYKKTNYDLDVCEAVGSLQSKLMETRPSVALGMGTLLLFSLPTSMAVVLFHFIVNWLR